MMPLSYTLAIAAMILLPILLAVLLRRRYPVFWLVFVVGALTFLGSQIVHLPLNSWLENIGLLPAAPLDSQAHVLRTALILGLTAGLCEELARVVGYGVLRWARRFEDGIMMGLGHGGLEAMLFGGVLTAATISSLLNLQGVDLESLNLSAAQLESLSLQRALFNSSPLYAIAPLIERILAITAQVTLAMIVLQAFSTRKPYLVLVAILYHALINAAAVYAVATTNQYWVAFLVFSGLLVPGWTWLARLWRARNRELAAADEKSPPAIPLRTTTALFMAALRKEMLYLWRTWRVLIVCAVMFVFAITSPLLTKFTPQLLGAIEGAEMFADLIPEMSVVDSLKQHIETMTQFGFILVILLGMGAVAGEKEQGTAGMVLSKPLSRGAFLLSKFLSQAMLYLLGFIIALGAGYYYTDVLFGDLEAATFLGINALLLVWLLVFASITLLGSSLGNSTGAAAGFALAGSILLIILGSLPNIGALLPNGILGWASQVAEGSQVTSSNWGAVVLSIVIILMALVSALGIFERQELR